MFCVAYYRPKSRFFGVHLRTEFGFNDILLGSQAFNLRTVLSEKVFDGGNFYEQIIQHFGTTSHTVPVNQAQLLYGSEWS